ncbi:MAG: carbohydrate ABC transporter permease [Oscillospiraceae bacterium]
MAPKRKIQNCTSDRIFNFFTYFILTLVLIIVAYPLYFTIISSISDPVMVATGNVTWRPIGINFEGYSAVFNHKAVMRGFKNSFIYTLFGTAINVFLTLPAAYSMSRPDLKGKNYIMLFFMITMFVSGGLIPTYLVIKNLGMIDTIWALVIPGAVSIYNLIIAMTFFKNTIPDSLLEAAKMDGCSNTKFFLKIVLPLSSAIIAILVLYYGVGHWNSYFNAMIYLTSPEKFPLQLELRSILVKSAMKQSMVKDLAELQRQQQLAELMKYSLIIISSVPILLVYPFIQKYFVKGVMIGSIKG